VIGGSGRPDGGRYEPGGTAGSPFWVASAMAVRTMSVGGRRERFDGSARDANRDRTMSCCKRSGALCGFGGLAVHES